MFVSEWSLLVADDLERTSDWDSTKDANKDFYRKFWTAQVVSYEKTAQGWVSLLISARQSSPNADI